MHNEIQRYCCGVAEVVQNLSFQRLSRAASMLLDCYERGNTVFVLGNGGSAATASHFACDLAKGTRSAGLPAFRVISLTDNVPLLTAWANDTSYDRVFAEQLATLVRTDDVVVVISASGNSANVVAAVEVANAAGAITIALTGRTGGQVRDLADLVVRAPSDSIEQVEDAHVTIAHGLCVALRERLQSDQTSEAAAVAALADGMAMVETVKVARALPRMVK